MSLNAIDKFHKTRRGYLVFGTVELAMCYGFVDWALDSGTIWWWIAAVILLLGVGENFFHAIFWKGQKK
jgi:hypothetical protein